MYFIQRIRYNSESNILRNIKFSKIDGFLSLQILLQQKK